MSEDSKDGWDVEDDLDIKLVADPVDEAIRREAVRLRGLVHELSEQAIGNDRWDALQAAYWGLVIAARPKRGA